MAEMKYETLLCELKGHTALMTLNRPERLNSYNEQMHADLRDFWGDVRENDDIWTVVVTGAGRAFASGADVREASAYMGQGGLGAPRWEYNVDFLRMFNQITAGGRGITRDKGERREGLHGNQPIKPVIAAVNGICCGDGLGFIYSADIVICAEEATFFDPHVTVSVSPPGIIAMPRLLPRNVAFAFMMLGLDQRMSSQRAHELGMVSEVVPLSQLIERSLDIAETINRGSSPLAVRATLAGAVLEGSDQWYEGARRGTKLYEDYVKFRTEDVKEGRKALLEKHKPQWKAR